jgi:ubiquinone/menaquinone biosynthesis C-methylase UbiE
MHPQSADGPPGPNDAEHSERSRVRDVYDAYAASDKYRRLWADTAANRFMVERKWEGIAGLLREARFVPAAGPCLDVGAGSGEDCTRMREIGVPGDQIMGMDLLRPPVRRARMAHPWLALLQGDAGRLPFRNDSLSLVYQSTMLSSILDQGWRRTMLGEAARVLRPGGLFLSFDTRYPNPWNANTRPLRARELREAFRGWRLWVRSVNGIPQLLRLLAPVSLTLCHAIESIPPLRSHLLVVARKPGS